MAEVEFLNVDDVLLIHHNAIENEGGLAGVRDIGMLEAAVAMPRQRFGGELLHSGLAAMAGAYLYHIAQNHPFHDGNKPAAAMTTFVFLDQNGCNAIPGPKALEKAIMAVASGTMSKPDLIDWMRERTQPRT